MDFLPNHTAGEEFGLLVCLLLLCWSIYRLIESIFYPSKMYRILQIGEFKWTIQTKSVIPYLWNDIK